LQINKLQVERCKRPPSWKRDAYGGAIDRMKKRKESTRTRKKKKNGLARGDQGGVVVDKPDYYFGSKIIRCFIKAGLHHEQRERGGRVNDRFFANPRSV